MKMQKLLAVIAASGMLFLPAFGYDRAEEQVLKEVSLDRSTLQLNSLPFSIVQILDYFAEAFGKRPVQIEGKSFVYSDRENPDEAAVITVSDLKDGVRIVLLATGNYGVTYIREFFEAPFFLIWESEELYMLLDRGPGIRSLTLERFHVQLSIFNGGGWIVVELEFRPSHLPPRHVRLLMGVPAQA